MSVLSFFDEDGFISRVICVPDDEDQFYIDLYGNYVAETSVSETQYVASGRIKQRPIFKSKADKPSIKADGIDVLTVSTVVSGTEVSLSGPVTDLWIEKNTSFSLTVNVPGNYLIQLRKWPYINMSINFDAT